MLITEIFGDEPYGPEDEIRDIALLEIAVLERLYLARKNPLYVWEALKQCNRFSVPVPAWALEYLGSVADRFDVLLVKESERSKESKSIASSSAVLEAIGFKVPGRSGSGTVFTRAIRDAHTYNLAKMIYRRKNSGQKLDFAFDEVARKKNCSRSKVRNAWNRHKQYFT